MGAVVFAPNIGDTIWILDHWGPKCGAFKEQWVDKVLVMYGNTPGIVDKDKCFVSETQCYSAAAARESAKAMEAMKLAAEYNAKACGINKKED